MLYVVHSFGPDHIRIMSVSGNGKLTPRMERYTCNTPDKPHRVPTHAVLSPDEKFLLVGTTFDLPIALSGTYPDGSPILWVPGTDGKLRSVASNAPDPDGIVIHRVNADGTLSEGSLQDGGGSSPFYIAFLHNRPDTFVIAYAVGDGVALGRIDEDGRIGVSKIVPIDTKRGKIAELCWLSVFPDDRFLYATVFGYSNISSFSVSTGSRSKSRRILRAPRSRATAPSVGFAETSAAARATVGFPPMVNFFTRSTGTRRSWSDTPPNRMARWKRLPAWRSLTTPRRDWRDSDLSGKLMNLVQRYRPARLADCSTRL